MGTLEHKTVVVGVSGGIAAYKTCALVSMLVKNGADVHVVMTENACKFVAPLTFETLSHNRAIYDTFDRNFTWEVEHVSLAKKADVFIIAPATANVIAKAAVGIADDFLTTTLLACTCPVIFAPAMNTAMLDDPATQTNIAALIGRGYTAVFGGCGRLACGDSGRGRMAEPEELFSAVEGSLAKKRDLEGKTVLVTSGATRAAIDPVRFLTNRSSGKMGYSVACAAHERGASVVYIKGFTDKFVIPDCWKTVDVTTTDELLAAIKANMPNVDIAVFAAAPCDYSASPKKQKIKSETLSLELKKAPDCAAWAGMHKGNAKTVVFAAETCDCEDNARRKLESKHADLAVLNDVTVAGAGFDVDTNVATLITQDKTERLELMTKRALADVILNRTLAL